jgi:hypothetical protein
MPATAFSSRILRVDHPAFLARAGMRRPRHFRTSTRNLAIAAICQLRGGETIQPLDCAAIVCRDQTVSANNLRP